VVRALDETFSLGLDPVEMAYVGKQCENEFVGVKSGIMDQFVSSIGEYGKALFIDCRTNEHSLHSLAPGYKVVIINSTMSRELASSAYNVRKARCEEAVSIFQGKYPEVMALRDVDEEMLLETWEKLPEVVARRVRHVVTENQRVLDTLELIAEGDMEGFGELMYDSHESLKHDYEVSSKYLDILVDSTTDIDSCLGARMTGAGFGGCTVNLVEDGHVDGFIEKVSERYFKLTAKRCEAYLA
jgi:galactokinase